MSSYVFRRLKDEDFDGAYAIIVEVTDWLLSRGIRQWIQPLPRDVYEQRQARGENFGLFVGREPAAVVSLMEHRPEYWADNLPPTRYKWLATLASARKFKGQKLGELAISEAEHYLILDGLPLLYLDCAFGTGALPDFYVFLGYETVARKELAFPWGTVDSVLLRKRLNISR